ncbi:MAG: YkgJ family cysteine cluster protein [Limisphaerales bacterium]
MHPLSTANASCSTISMDAESELCTRCGMCCDGTLFASVALDETEKSRLGRELLPQRCVFLNGGCCQIYAQRPSRCQVFQCQLLEDMHASTESHQNALQIVADTKKLRDELHGELLLALPSLEGLPLVEALKKFRKQSKSLMGNALQRYLSHKREVLRLKKLLDQKLDEYFYPAQDASSREV